MAYSLVGKEDKWNRVEGKWVLGMKDEVQVQVDRKRWAIRDWSCRWRHGLKHQRSTVPMEAMDLRG